MSFEHFHGWHFHHFPGQSVAMPDHPLSEETFPNFLVIPALLTDVPQPLPCVSLSVPFFCPGLFVMQYFTYELKTV